MKNVIIIGSGCAGLTAAIYASRAGHKVTVLSGKILGGLLTTTDSVDNFPGFPLGINGYDLMSNMMTQAQRFGTKIIEDNVDEINEFSKFVRTEEGLTFNYDVLILAMGSQPRKLGFNNEEQYYNKGISFCATCDGFFYKDKVVAVVGGGDTAVEDAIFLSQFAKKVYLIHRRNEFRAEVITVKKLKKIENVEILTDCTIESIKSDCKQLELKNLWDRFTIDIDGLFVAIGQTPSTNICEDVVNLELDEEGYIKVDSFGRTSVNDIFACGDCVDKKYKQAIIACASGAKVAMNI